MASERARLLQAIKGDPDLIARLLHIAEPDFSPLRQVSGPDSVIRHFDPLLRGLDHERFAVMCLDRRNRVQTVKVLTVGSDRACIVDSLQIFRHALRTKGCAAVILAHNHPSGDPTPSSQDHEVTRRVIRAGSIIGIRVLDHLVVGRDSHVSLAELGVDFRCSYPLTSTT